MTLPLKESDYPGIFVSVVLISPRLPGEVTGFGELDLKKPTFRMGYKEIKVRRPTEKTKVRLSSDKEVYKPGESMKLKIQLDSKEPKPFEVAIAVVDESVFSLLKEGRSHYDPEAKLRELSGLDVKNYSLLTRLIGRQKFEKKGASQGGGGGAGLTGRQNFKYVAYWNPGLSMESGQESTVSFSLPDNLTGWRIFAIASDEADEIYLKDHLVRVNKKTELRKVMPSFVERGDRFSVGFTVTNRMNRKRSLDYEILKKQRGGKADQLLKKDRVDLEPFQRVLLQAMDESQDALAKELIYEAKAGDSLDQDQMMAKLPVLAREYRSQESLIGSSIEDKITLPVKVPEGPNISALRLELSVSNSVLSGLSQSLLALKNYPYGCFEQKLSRAIGAYYYLKLKDSMPKVWPNAEEELKSILKSVRNYQNRAGGMAFYKPSPDHASPYLTAYTALALSFMPEYQEFVPNRVKELLISYLRNLLKEDPKEASSYSRASLLQVRAMAVRALLDLNVSLEDHEWERIASKGEDLDAFFKALLLPLPVLGSKQKKSWTQSVLANQEETAHRLRFQGNRVDSPYLLSSDVRTHCGVLASMADLKSNGDSPLPEKSLQKAVNHLLTHLSSDSSYVSTQEQVFCLHALVQYQKAMEQHLFAGPVTVSQGPKAVGTKVFSEKAERWTQNLAAKSKAETLQLEKEGDGRIYYELGLSYVDQDLQLQPINRGFELRREVSVLRDGKWSLYDEAKPLNKGEIVQVDLYLHVPSERYYVVVDDRLPACFEALNQDLAGQSQRDQKNWPRDPKAYFFSKKSWRSATRAFQGFYHQEITHDSVRFYSESLQKGDYHLSYRAQVVANGKFKAKSPLAFEMYQKETFAKDKEQEIQVEAL